MCGIAGILNFDPHDGVDGERLRRMRDVLRHRGPDGEGLWCERSVGLAHRRLSIVDIEGGSQPMSTADESAWIAFNGEIYNHPALQSDFERSGVHYRTRSDTESILHVYQRHRTDCVDHLTGMFAFAIWDRGLRQLLLARDRLGIKPLYYALTGERIIFASEIKSIFESGYVRPLFNEGVLAEYLATGFVAGEETLFRGVKKLLPAHTLIWSQERGVVVKRYWHLPDAPSVAAPSIDVQARELRERLSESVRSHLMSDVPVGLFLSGGIDSTALAALMAPMVRDRVKTFSVGFAEREGNELHYARLAAQSIGSEHREVVVSAEQFFRELPRLVWHEDEPIAFPSSVPLYFVSALAREHVKVVLTGEGADELFCGYNRYRVTAWNQRLGQVYERWMPSRARDFIAAKTTPQRYLSRTFLAMPANPRALFFEGFAFFGERRRNDVLNNGHGAGDPFAAAFRHYQAASGGVLDRMSRTDLQTYLVELLMKQDQMSMAASIESRVPFLDHQFVEHVVGLPADSKLRGWQTKFVLRKAVRDLIPREIRTRRKMGFPVPIESWFRTGYRHLIDEFVLSARARERNLFQPAALSRIVAEHRSGGARHGARLWLLMNLEIWQRIFIDGQPVETIMEPAMRLRAAA